MKIKKMDTTFKIKIQKFLWEVFYGRVFKKIKKEEIYRSLEHRWILANPDSELIKRIEARMMELNKEQLPEIHDYNNLYNRLYYSSPGLELQQQILTRMMELNKEQLPEIHDYNNLYSRLSISENDLLRTQITDRMKELLVSISKTNTPDWLMELIKDCINKQPENLQETWRVKLREIIFS